MQLKLTLNTLLNYLQNNKFMPQLQADTNQISILFRSATIEFAIFLRLLDEGELLQILIYIPIQLKDETLNDTARLLHKLNHDLDVPGFGISEYAKLIFYRIVMPCPNKICNTDLLNKYLQIGPKACTGLYQLISSIVDGKNTFDELMQAQKEQ
ncbi:MAG: YbjN domain-containing protein [Chlamydiales bacterium]|nr:YbjN domain-containing protein [Chlamydiales bacterium]